MATFLKRTNGWQATIEVGFDPITGKRVRKSKGGFKTKKEAQLYASQLNVELVNGLQVSKNKLLFNDFLLTWFNSYKSKSLSINTRTSYLGRINNHILPYFKNYELCKIDPLVVQNFYYHLIDKQLQPDSCKKVIEVLNGCFNYAKKLKLITYIPTDIEKFKQDKPKILFWSEDELKFFLSEINLYPIYLPTLLACLTGIRIGELCGLRWINVDLVQGVIHIREQAVEDKINKILVHTSILKSSSSYRSISIPQSLATILKRHKEHNPLSKFVFEDKYYNMCKPKNISMDFTHKVCKFKNIPQISFHGLRHTHATMLLLKGENIKVISERLGHKSIKVTLDTYSHVLPSMKLQTASLLEDIFF